MMNAFRTKKSKIISIILLGIVLATAWYMVKYRHAKAGPVQDSVVVEIDKVKLGNIPIEAQSVGTLVASQSIQISPEVAGQVARILVNDGAFVKKGTPLIQIEDTVKKVKAESAKANFHYSQTNYNRLVILGKKGVISQQAIDQALADLKEKKALAEENRVLAEKMLLVAPFDGTLGKVKTNPGEFVAVGQQIATLTDIKNLRVEYNISEKYLAHIKKGQLVTLTTTAYPGKEFFGHVAYVAPTINTEDRTISLYADVPNASGMLTAGLFVNVKHVLGKDSNVLMIPAVSLVATIDGQQVFKVIQGKAVAVPVKIGQRTIDQVQITQGLSLNDVVVTSGQHKIKDGTPVKPKSEV